MRVIRGFLGRWHGDLYGADFTDEEAIQCFRDLMTLPLADLEDEVYILPSWREAFSKALQSYEKIDGDNLVFTKNGSIYVEQKPKGKRGRPRKVVTEPKTTTVKNTTPNSQGGTISYVSIELPFGF